jgi:hypothetical protein
MYDLHLDARGEVKEVLAGVCRVFDGQSNTSDSGENLDIIDFHDELAEVLGCLTRIGRMRRNL